ncbi:hypothetical protein BC834DRAFT_58233 [Gloeopeniophorella convolvens]|nr:hypothetical protein BC834DRAFT_58233 [Gloeopeniophorella convolvens]
MHRNQGPASVSQSSRTPNWSKMSQSTRLGLFAELSDDSSRESLNLGSRQAFEYPMQRMLSQGPLQEPGKGYSDGSGALFSMYLERAEEEDRRMVESWKGDAEGILVFTGLFSAAVATFLGNTYQSLQLNSQDASAFYLAHLYQRTVAENGTQVSIPSTLLDPSSFSPPTSSVWVNTLWFLSLVMSLTCALLATMLQQWARRYLRVTQTRYQPYKRARIRSFFAEGVKKFHVPWAVEALPALLHISVFLFYAGLCIFLFGINLTVFGFVVSWVTLCASLYFAITLMPMVFSDSPYHTPFSTLAWTLSISIFQLLLHIVQALSRILSNCVYGVKRSESSRDWRHITLTQRLALGMVRIAEFAAMCLPPSIDSRALASTYDSLEEDHEMEQFLAGIPGFLNSTAVNEPKVVLAEFEKFAYRNTLGYEITSLVARSLHAGLLTGPARRRRFEVCFKAVSLVVPTLFNSAELRGANEMDLLALYEEFSDSPDLDVAWAAQCMATRAMCGATESGLQKLIPILERSSASTRKPLHPYFNSNSRPVDVKAAYFLHFLRHTVLRNLDTLPNEKRATAIDFTLALASVPMQDASPNFDKNSASCGTRWRDGTHDGTTASYSVSSHGSPLRIKTYMLEPSPCRHLSPCKQRTRNSSPFLSPPIHCALRMPTTHTLRRLRTRALAILEFSR